MKSYCSIGDFTSSQVQLHLLYSMLPKQYEKFDIPQIKKSKEFYKPQQCIWNNAHRTSDKLYKYYHQGMDSYKKLKEPLIKQQQAQDRINKEMSRIKLLSQKRNQNRTKFLGRKCSRIQLQTRSGTRKLSTNSSFEHLNSIQSANTRLIKSLKDSSNKLLTSEIKSFSNLSLASRSHLNIKSDTPQKQVASVSYKTFLQSVDNYDKKKGQTIQLLKKRQQFMKKQIRQSFLKQKQTNKQKQNMISPQRNTRRKLSYIPFNQNKSLKNAQQLEKNGTRIKK